MRWQTVARLVIAAAGIGVAVLVYLQLQDRPVAEPGTDAPLLDPGVVAAAEDGRRLILGADGGPTVTIDFKAFRQRADDTMEFDDVSAVFGKDGVTHRITAKSAVATGRAGPTGMQPSQVVFKGDVKLSAENGISVEVEDEATFYNNEQKTVIPGRMAFTRGRLSGSGVGAELFMEQSVLWMNSEARLTVAPARAGDTPVEASATRIGLAEADHFMRLEGNAVMTQQAQRLSADNARVAFTQEGHGIQFIELRGNSSVRSTDTSARRPNLKAGDINLAFADGTGLLSSATLVVGATLEMPGANGSSTISGSQIETAMAPDGETLTKLQASAPVVVTLPAEGAQPAKRVCAQGLQADGDNKGGLTRAYFSGGVEYREGPAGACGRATPARVATAETLTLDLDGALADVKSALFQRNFRVVDGDLTATAVDGRYDSVAETLELRSPAGATRPKVVTPDMDVIASEIDANLKTDAFDARGRGQQRVESTLKPSASAKTSDASVGLFERGKTLTGTSERLQYDRTAGTAVYSGGVFLVQGDSQLLADRVAMDDTKGDVTATGSVRSTLVMAAAPGTTATNTAPTRVSADTLVYTDSARTAVYSGAATLETSSGEKLAGERITLSLEPVDRKLKSMEVVAAKGAEVRVALLEGKYAIGHTVTYDAAADRYLVTGTPAKFIAPASEPGKCTVTSGTALRFSRTSGAASVTNQGGALGTTLPVNCAEVIK